MILQQLRRAVTWFHSFLPEM